MALAIGSKGPRRQRGLRCVWRHVHHTRGKERQIDGVGVCERAQKQASVDVLIASQIQRLLRCMDVPALRDSFPEIANTVMDSAMKSLWKRTKYSTDTLDKARVEVGGYIIRKNGVYSFESFVYGYGSNLKHGPCFTSVKWPPPDSAVADIHTHPFKKNDPLRGCGPKFFDPETNEWYRYIRAPSGWVGADSTDRPGDYGSVKTESVKLGRNIKGFIVDADGLINYDLSDLNPSGRPIQPPRYGIRGRCSY